MTNSGSRTISPAPGAPSHLSLASKRLWRRLITTYDFDDGEMATLTLALEALDRCAEARSAIERDGAYQSDRFGQLKAHPAVAVERDSALRAAKLLRDLHVEAADDESWGKPRPGARLGVPGSSHRGGAPGSGHVRPVVA